MLTFPRDGAGVASKSAILTVYFFVRGCALRRWLRRVITGSRSGGGLVVVLLDGMRVQWAHERGALHPYFSFPLVARYQN
jgi:hypothetical protein